MKASHTESIGVSAMATGRHLLRLVYVLFLFRARASGAPCGKSKQPAPAPAKAGRAARCGRAQRLGRLVGMWLMALAGPSAAWSQYSPNCLLNGSRRCCAHTPGGPASPGWSSETVVFADHQAFRLQRLESSCQNRGTLRSCQATILPSNGQEPPIAARYVGEAYEGGYRHHYVSDSGQLSLSFFFLD